jgi:hypothetical protein
VKVVVVYPGEESFEIDVNADESDGYTDICMSTEEAIIISNAVRRPKIGDMFFFNRKVFTVMRDGYRRITRDEHTAISTSQYPGLTASLIGMN